MPYTVPQNIDPNKIFLVNLSELEGRWDPTIFQNQFRFISKQYPNRKLSSVALIDPKVSFSKLKDDDDISFIPMNIVNEDDGTIKESLYKKVIETKGFTRFQDGDLIWAKITPCMQNGKSAVVRKLRNGYGCGSTEFFVIRPKDDTLLIDYVYILLRDNRILQTATNYFGGSAGQQRVSKTFLENLTIPVPPLHIQQQIVNDYNAALSQRKKKLSESKVKLASIDQYLLNELGITLPEDSHEKTFIVNYKDVDGGRLDPSIYKKNFKLISSRYENVKLSKHAFINPSTTYKKLTADSKISFVPMEQIDEIYSEISFMEDKKVSESTGYTRFMDGDLLWAKITPCMQNGKSAIARNLRNGYGCGSTEFFVLRPRSNELSIEYLHNILHMQIVRKTAMLHFGGSAGQQRVSSSFLEKFNLPLPPLTKQREIANHISAIRAEAKALEQEANVILEQAKKKVEELILGYFS